MRTGLLKLLDASIGRIWCRLLTGVGSSVGCDDVEGSGVKRGKILVIRPGGLGDMILLIPVLRVIRRHFPEAEVDVACQSRNSDILRISGLKFNVIEFDSRPVHFLRELKKRRYDTVIDTEQFHHFSAVFAGLTGAGVRVGFRINPARNAQYTHLVDYSMDGFEGDQFMRLLEPLGIRQCSYDLAGSIPVPERVNVPGLSEGQYATMHAGVSSVHKSWPAERFREVALGIMNKGLDVVLVGDNADTGVSRRIAGEEADGARSVIPVAGSLDLSATVSVIGHSSLFVGVDSGLAHIARAMDVPSVTLFGASDSRKWGMHSSRHLSIQKSGGCLPCAVFGYYRACKDIACMKAIKADEVLSSVDSVMSASAD